MLTAEIIRLLDLKPHPEGGRYRQTFRDSKTVDGVRAVSTAIYFLLARGERSHWHRVDAVEICTGTPARRSSLKSRRRTNDVSASCWATILPPPSGRNASFRRTPGRRRARSAIGPWPAALWRRASSSRHSIWRRRAGSLPLNRHDHIERVSRPPCVPRSFFVCSALQDEIDHVVVLRLVCDIEPPGEMGQPNFDALHDRILLENAACDLVGHRGQRGRL